MIRIEKSIFLKKNYFFFRLGQNFSSGANFGAKSLTHGQLTCLIQKEKKSEKRIKKR